MDEKFHPDLWVPSDYPENAPQSHQDARTDDLEPQTASSPFVIDSEEKANWYLRKLASNQAEVGRVITQFDAIMKDLTAEYNNLQARHQADLEQWAKSQLKGGKRNLKLFQGTIHFRMVPKSLRVVDRNVALEWTWKQKDGHRFRRVSIEVNATDYIAYMKETGEALPGVEVTPEHESCSITFGKKE